MNTAVKIEQFKDSGKFYASFDFETKTKAFDIPEIKKEVEERPEFIKGMDFTIEVTSISLIENAGWNKYLCKSIALLTVDKLKSMKPHTIIAAGEIENSPEGLFMVKERPGEKLYWIAKRGEIHDWAIYVGWKEWGFDETLRAGDKLFGKENIRKIVPCDDQALKMYRK